MSEDQTEEFTYAELQALKRHARNEAIEECARMVDERADYHSSADYKELLHAVAAAIRALKDKP